jgi:hypothetical protein
MRIGIVGGAERSETQYVSAAEQAGHELEFHSGHMSRRQVASLEAMVKRCDFVVITTDVNSHNAVRLARSFARTHARKPHLCRRFSLHDLQQLLDGGLPSPA